MVAKNNNCIQVFMELAKAVAHTLFRASALFYLCIHVNTFCVLRALLALCATRREISV